MKDVIAAFRKLLEAKATFVSRGDDSGTDKMEKGYWGEVGRRPEGRQYLSAGQGMGEVLTMAGHLGAYTLTDRATYGAYRARIALEILVEGDAKMFNPYGVIAVSPARYPGRQLQGRDAVRRVDHGRGRPARHHRLPRERRAALLPHVALIWRLAAALLALCVAGGARAAELRLGATYTLEDSGLLAVLLPAFSTATGVAVRPLIAGTGQVMKYAENGDVDVVFTHSRPDEEKLVARGIGKARSDVMWNDFVIAGPASDPARVRGLRDAPQALKRIREAGAKFVSRGDDSGTHKKELQLWMAAGGLVPWSGYLSSGQGAGRALMMAHELGAYDLVDRATLKQLAGRFPDGDPRRGRRAAAE